MRIDKSYRVIFISADESILVQIREAFGSSHPITETIDKRNGSTVCYLYLYSKQLYQKLENHGGLRNKSRSIEFPDVPRKFLPDFVRGYFDGDGSVFFVKYARTKDKRLTRELRTNFTSGSRRFLDQLMLVLNKEIGLPIKKLGVYDNSSSFKLGYGMKDSDTLLRYMYYAEFPIGLKRKASYISKIPEYQVHNKPGWRNWHTRST